MNFLVTPIKKQPFLNSKSNNLIDLVFFASKQHASGARQGVCTEKNLQIYRRHLPQTGHLHLSAGKFDSYSESR